MKVERYVTGMLGTNCYLAINEETKQTVVVDPADCPDYLMEHVRSEGLQIEAILLTHGHFDHIMGIDGFRKGREVPVYVHEAEEEMMNQPQMNLSAAHCLGYTFSRALYIREGQILPLAGYEFEVIHTPGHTRGGCCYYVREESILFSGDTLFRCSVGRTDFPGGSSSDLIRSVHEKLMPLPDDTHVYPGHMEETTIGYERANNPFI